MIWLIIIIIVFLCILILHHVNKESMQYLDGIDGIQYADDITGLNKTAVDNIFYVSTVEDVIHIIKLAKRYNKKIIARGEKHSMGGHTLVKDGYIIDTKYMNNILNLDKINKTVTVEPGVTWYELIYYLNAFGLSPKILQSYASFSVGGSVSVNIHGITSDYGLYKSVIELEIVNYNGNVIKCNRNKNKELFDLVIGGYGLFGIITKVKLIVTNNSKLDMKMINANIYNFQEIYSRFIGKDNIKLARINVLNMEEINLYVFVNIKSDRRIISKLGDKPKDMSVVMQILYKWIMPNEEAQNLRFKLEKTMGRPFDIKNNDISRNELLYESADAISKLYSPFIDINKTHILQEYFIPNLDDNFTTFMEYLKKVFINNKGSMKNINLLNITIRYVKKDTETFLKYAKTDMYSFVFYYRINKENKSDEKLKRIHNLLVNKILTLNGTFYLPYRLHYTPGQLISAYPEINKFFQLKEVYDPDKRFVNLWYQQYKN